MSGLSFLPLVFTAPEDSLLYVGRYDPVLVTLSVAAAILASYTALLVSRRLLVAATTHARRLWTAAGGLAMGAGIWAMHFVGMLAFSLPCATTYDPLVTLLSMVPGVLRQVMPCLSASPERGLTCPSKPSGISMTSPVGTSARRPGRTRRA